MEDKVINCTGNAIRNEIKNYIALLNRNSRVMSYYRFISFWDREVDL